MPSLLPGYEYDIFISYRQKDNKYDGWVTEFVSNLKKELEATFKEEVSIYFDENPHDGLLETHSVDKSLERKLKCLIFIPIISQTYCDPKSFAWQHEFCAFIESTQTDSLGLAVTLHNGNVTNRVLPVQIHELEQADRTLFESKIGGHLRALEFIYKERGVNRPLRPTDLRTENLNKTDYRNQVNKVANSVKELIQALRIPQAHPQKTPSPSPSTVFPFRKILIAVALAVTALTLYLLIPHRDERYRLAVLPFQNQTGDSGLDPYSIGMASTATGFLATSKQFNSVSSLAAVLLVSKSESPALRQYGERLGAEYLLTGFYRKHGDYIRVDIEFVEAETEAVKWSEYIDWDMKSLDLLERSIKDVLNRRFSLSKQTTQHSTSNPNAYAHFQRGQELLRNAYGDSTNGVDAFTPIIQQHAAALELDSLFLDAWTEMIAVECFVYQGRAHSPAYGEQIESHLRAFHRLLPESSWQKDLVMGEYYYRVKGEYDSALARLNRVLDSNPNSEHAVYALSNVYARQLKLKEAIAYASRLLQINRSHGGHWANLGLLLQKANDPAHAMRAFLKAWDYSQSTNLARAALINAVETGYPINHLPAALKERVKPDYDLWDKLITRDWSVAKKMSRMNHDPILTAAICRELNERDSAVYWTQVAMRNGTIDSATYYEFLGDRARAMQHILKQADNISEEQKLGQRTREISLAIAFDDFEGATTLLRKLIADYPGLDHWSTYRHFPFFDKIRNQYKPFDDLINQPTPPPLVNMEELISF